LLNEVGKWAMIVENKVWSAEHSDQLGRYHRFVRKTYPGWRVFGVYLTPFGSLPSRDEDRENYSPLIQTGVATTGLYTCTRCWGHRREGQLGPLGSPQG
jgi:hypothetical protein